MFVPIWIAGIGQVSVMQQVITIINSSNRTNWAQQKHIAKQIVYLALVKQPAMHAVVGQNK